jgi:chitinase
VTVHDLKRHPTQANWLYAATANGVYTSENGGATWSTTNDGPASVRVRELFFYDPSTLIAVTYGRGMWRTTVQSGGPADYSDVWWGGVAENGWGMAINQKNQIQFISFYVYDSTGKPVWYVMPGGQWNASFTTYTGQLYQPTSSPYNAYNVASYAAGAPVGNATVSYTSDSAATLQYVINGIAGQKSLQRFVFGPADPTPGLRVGDIWWGGTSQNGWGISITQQNRTLFAAWYTYGADGKTTWFVMPGGTWAGNTYNGELYTAQSSPWVGVTYNTAQYAATRVGTISLAFTDANNANMSYTINGVTQTKPITRLPF